MGNFSPQVKNLIYFFAITAFKPNANNPAGISPVVNKSFKLIPKSGMFLTKSGNKDIPIPKDKESPRINMFLWFISDLKIELGNPTEYFMNDDGNRVFLYKTKKYGIPCERKFEINKNNVIQSFTSSGCI